MPELNAMTKKDNISTVARLYDILGLLGPVVIWCKIFVEEDWNDTFL